MSRTRIQNLKGALRAARMDYALERLRGIGTERAVKFELKIIRLERELKRVLGADYA